MPENFASPSGIPYQDAMRHFRRDSPARQFDAAGQQKCGIIFALPVQYIQV